LLQTATGQKLANPAGTIGSSLAGVGVPGNTCAHAKSSLSVTIVSSHKWASRTSQISLSTTDRITLDLQGKSIAYDLPAFTKYDVAFGAEKDGGKAQVYGENLTDTRAQLFANYSLGCKAVTDESSPDNWFALQLSVRRQVASISSAIQNIR